MAIEPEVWLRASRSWFVVSVAGIVLFGAPLVIEMFHPGVPAWVIVACIVFTVASIGALLSMPRVALGLTGQGLVYRPPFWRAEVRLAWADVREVSIYRVSTAYSTTSFARVSYVSSDRGGSFERRVLINRVGNMKAEELVDLIDQYRSRAVAAGA